MVTPARLWLQVFLFGFAVIVALMVLTLTTTVPYGDLSRIGQVSDRQFGWRIAQPHVDPKYLHASPIAEADVLVLGDSFSATSRWQSALTQAGYRVTTVFWAQQANEMLCDDFDAWLDRAGFRGKVVVIESVERLLANRLAKTQNCTNMPKPFDASAGPFMAPLEQVPSFQPNWQGKLTLGYATHLNTWKAQRSAGGTAVRNGTWVRPVVNGCSLFSNRFCSKALFFSEDDDNGELTPENVAQMRAFNKAQSERSIIWMVIPNKTTVYVQPDHSKDFVTAFREAGLGPDLFSFAQEQKTKIRDFYFPNDTHLSMHGQAVLGQVMLEAVRKIVPVPPGKAS